MTSVRRATASALRHGTLLLTSLAMVMPFVWMVSLSLKPANEIFTVGFSLLPTDFAGLQNYGQVLGAAPMARFILNGAFVCSAILVLQIAVSAPCAYALAKHEFRGRDTLFKLVLVALLIPHQVLALPLFVLFFHLGLLNTYAALILPFAVSPFAIFLFRQYFRSVPDDLVHAARLDGLSEAAIVWRVMLPTAFPAVVAFSIFSFVGHWNDLFWPLIAVRDQALMPPPLGIVMFRSEQAGYDYGPLMAAATMVVAPLLVAFLLAQRWFVDGLTVGAVK